MFFVQPDPHVELWSPDSDDGDTEAKKVNADLTVGNIIEKCLTAGALLFGIAVLALILVRMTGVGGRSRSTASSSIVLLVVCACILFVLALANRWRYNKAVARLEELVKSGVVVRTDSAAYKLLDYALYTLAARHLADLLNEPDPTLYERVAASYFMGPALTLTAARQATKERTAQMATHTELGKAAQTVAADLVTTYRSQHQ